MPRASNPSRQATRGWWLGRLIPEHALLNELHVPPRERLKSIWPFVIAYVVVGVSIIVAWVLLGIMSPVWMTFGAGGAVVPQHPLAFAATLVLVGIAPFVGPVVAFMLLRPFVRARLRMLAVRHGAKICPRCGYDMNGVQSPVCPECGHDSPAAVGQS